MLTPCYFTSSFSYVLNFLFSLLCLLFLLNVIINNIILYIENFNCLLSEFCLLRYYPYIINLCRAGKPLVALKQRHILRQGIQ